jgi:hypothetical protein
MFAVCDREGGCWIVLETTYSKAGLSHYMGPDSNSTKLLDHPKTKLRSEGASEKINSCRKVLFQVTFKTKQRDLALPSMSLLLLRAGTLYSEVQLRCNLYCSLILSASKKNVFTGKDMWYICRPWGLTCTVHSHIMGLETKRQNGGLWQMSVSLVSHKFPFLAFSFDPCILLMRLFSCRTFSDGLNTEYEQGNLHLRQCRF